MEDIDDPTEVVFTLSLQLLADHNVRIAMTDDDIKTAVQLLQSALLAIDPKLDNPVYVN